MTIEDERLQELHESGLAQEFEVHGTTDLEVVEVDPATLVPAASGTPGGPGGDGGGRDGARDDPGRDRDGSGRGGR